MQKAVWQIIIMLALQVAAIFSLSGQQLVADINLTSVGADPRGLKPAPGSLVFLANSFEFGTELFQSDGTAAGTHVLLDVEPGATDGCYAYYSVIGNAVYAITFDINFVRSIWKIDLATQEALLLHTVPTNSGYTLGLDDAFFAVGNNVLFTVRNGNGMFELWKTDGTPDGTALVSPLAVNAFPDQFTVLQEVLYFVMDDGLHGRELWRSDGTEAGTYLVKDIDQQNTGYGLFELTAFQDRLYFVATEQTFYYELWTSDGTEAGTKLFADLSPNGVSSGPGNLTVAGDQLFFTARVEMQAGLKLWVTDGTPQNTNLVTSNINAAQLRASDGQLYFIGQDGINGAELWTSDGTPAGTALLADIIPGLASGDYGPSLNIGSDGLTVYFAAGDSLHGRELWKTSGLPGEATLAKDIFPGSRASDLTEITGWNGRVFFTATDGLHGRELYTSDGSAAGTQRVTALNPTGAGSSPYEFEIFQDLLVFSAHDGVHGFEPWSSDGTSAGTTLLLDVYPGIENSAPFFEAATSSGLFFLADNPEVGREIWKTDGTTAGTVLLKDIHPGQGDGSTERIVSLGDKIVFNAYRPGEQEELWVSDGTTAGTQLLLDIVPNGQSFPQLLRQTVSFNGVPTALFNARSGSPLQDHIWKTDGTVAGTAPLLVPGLFYIGDPVQLGAEVIFSGGGLGYVESELYKTDGSAAGTSLVKDIFPGPGSGGLSYLTPFKNQVFFSADDGFYGSELWRTDGSPAGTFLLKDIAVGNAASLPNTFYNFNDSLLFFTAANNAINDFELWVTTGTADGTSLLKDIRPGDEPSYPRDFVTFGNLVYFSADDGVHGRELWQTDGTPAGTFLVKDLYPGLASGDPSDLLIFKDYIYFSANDGLHGQELWRFPADSVTITHAPVSTHLNVYPNPAAQVLNIAFDRTGLWDVAAYNVLGKLADRFQVAGLRQHQVSITHWPVGFYSLVATNRAAGTQVVAKIQVVRE